MSDRDALVLPLVRGLEHAATALNVINDATRREVAALLSPRARRLLAALTAAPTEAAAPLGDAAEAIEASDPQPKRQKASASKPTGKPVEVIDVDAPSIPKKKTMPKKQATMTSFFGSKKPKEENGSKFPGWGKAKPPEDDDPTLDDLRAKARAAQENTANDEAIARSLEED